MNTKKIPYESHARRLCIVVDNLNPHAGWGRLAGEIAQRFEQQGWHVGFIVSGGDCPANGISIPMRKSTPLAFGRLVQSLARVRSFIKDFDIVLCFDINPYGVLISIAGLGLKTKIVIDALGTYSLFTQSWVRNALISWAYSHADGVLIVSEFVRRSIEKNGFKFKAYHIVPVGVDTQKFLNVSPIEYGDTPYILSVGGVKRRKGYHLTVSAFSILATKYPKLRYVIVGAMGDGEYAKQIEKIIKENGLENRVVFKSGVSDSELTALYAGAEIYVQTSVTDEDAVEGFGMSYLEASSCGTPTIGARDSGAEAAIEDGITGFLVEHDPEDIARAMSRILEDHELSERMGKAAVLHAKDFSWERIANRYRMYLNEVLR